jgi:hypothetical protein
VTIFIDISQHLDIEVWNDLDVELKEGDEVTVVAPGGSPYWAKAVDHQHAGSRW